MSFRPLYHLTPPKGWMNDPNGLVFWKGSYYVFYQHYPYDTAWGPMHWRLARSGDLYHFEDKGIVLRPEKPYEKELGCFSGSALPLSDGRLAILYTGAAKEAQRQCLAFMDPEGRIEKDPANPVISENDLPKGYAIADFRDPYLFQRDDAYFALLVSRVESSSRILLFRSIDLRKWSFVGESYRNDAFGTGMFECPSLVRVGDKDLLLFSRQGIPEEDYPRGREGSFALPGRLDLESGAFLGEGDPIPLDYGLEFYAALGFPGKEGKPLLYGWQEGWDRLYPSASEGYAGKMAFPKELILDEDGRLLQKDPPEIEEIFEEGTRKEGPLDANAFNALMLEGDALRLSLGVENPKRHPFCLSFYGTEKGECVTLSFDGEKMVLDRSRNGSFFHSDEKPDDLREKAVLPLRNPFFWQLDLTLDRSAFELSFEDGALLARGSAYPQGRGRAISLEGDIVVKEMRIRYLKKEDKPAKDGWMSERSRL